MVHSCPRDQIHHHHNTSFLHWWFSNSAIVISSITAHLDPLPVVLQSALGDANPRGHYSHKKLERYGTRWLETDPPLLLTLCLCPVISHNDGTHESLSDRCLVPIKCIAKVTWYHIATLHTVAKNESIVFFLITTASKSVWSTFFISNKRITSNRKVPFQGTIVSGTMLPLSEIAVSPSCVCLHPVACHQCQRRPP